MTLYLQGGGSYPETKELDIAFFGSLEKNRKLLYIPTAMIGSFTYEECNSYISNIISSLGLSIDMEMVSELENLQNVDLNVYSGIYIGGGNTFRLLDELKRNNLVEKLINYLDIDGSICGGSAGAIIFGENINTSPDANIVNLKDSTALKYLKGYSVWCHYKESDSKQIIEYVKHHRIPVIALTESSGIKFTDNQIIFMGSKSYLFTKDEKIEIFSGSVL